MGRRKRLTESGQRPPLSVAARPDRSLALLGAYVRFKKGFSLNGNKIASRGQVGIVVRDTRGVCTKGQVAVSLPGAGKLYHPVPPKCLKVQT